jgi:predicted hydrocarbon binding protein
MTATDRPDDGEPRIGGLESLYSWDEENGVIKFVPANKRAFLLTARAWDSMEQDLIGKLGKGAPAILDDMGYSYGRSTAQDYRVIAAGNEDIAGYLQYLGRMAGWGSFAVSGDSVRGSKLRVRVHNCIFCTSRNSSVGRNDQCYFLRGVCRGIADSVFGSEHIVTEVKCLAQRLDCCEFLISGSPAMASDAK